MMFKKILIANRGEIVIRIGKTCRKLGIRTVTIYDEREKNTCYVKSLDEAYSLGSGKISDTFLNISKIISIAKKAGVDAIHPGYGFLSENYQFAQQCKEKGIVFIGPDSAAIRLMGNKLQALMLVREIGIPVIPGIYGSIEEIEKAIDDSIFPCLIKASAGGGGKAMHLVERKADLPEKLLKSSKEAKKYFGDESIYIEKYLKDPRHIEVQILADQAGNQIHIFERECTIQRRYQKVIEESPSLSINSQKRKELIRDALKIAREVNYEGVGTIEFLLDADGTHYFLEMNTRIQVEHPVTEEITGIDIVEEQIRIASGLKIKDELYTLQSRGHAIEARLYAEDPEHNYLPSPGLITFAKFPQSEGVRIETAVESGDNLEMDFDPLLAKIITHATSRKEAIKGLYKAVQSTHIHGIKTNKTFLLNLIEEPDFIKGKFSTNYINQKQKVLLKERETDEKLRILIALVGLFLSSRYQSTSQKESMTIADSIGFWRILPVISVNLDGGVFQFQEISLSENQIKARHNEIEFIVSGIKLTENYIEFEYSDTISQLYFSWNITNCTLYLSGNNNSYLFNRLDWLNPSQSYRDTSLLVNSGEESQILAPLSGQIIKINYKNNVEINKGECLLVIESMKMENEIRFHRSGKIKELFVKEGEQVQEGDLLVEFN